jgi:hypothetical protein
VPLVGVVVPATDEPVDVAVNSDPLTDLLLGLEEPQAATASTTATVVMTNATGLREPRGSRYCRRQAR